MNGVQGLKRTPIFSLMLLQPNESCDLPALSLDPHRTWEVTDAETVFKGVGFHTI